MLLRQPKVLFDRCEVLPPTPQLGVVGGRLRIWVIVYCTITKKLHMENNPSSVFIFCYVQYVKYFNK